MRDGHITDKIYWRIVPVGFATVFLSCCILVLLSLSVAVKGWDGETGPLNMIFAAMGAGLLARIFGMVTWLPLILLWNVTLDKLSIGFDLTRAAVGLSTGMAFALTALATLVVVGRGGGSLRQYVILGLWTICTALIAGGLTLLAFKTRKGAFGDV